MSGPKLVLPSLFCMLNSTFVARTKKSLSCTERAVPNEFDYIFLTLVKILASAGLDV